MVSDRGRAFRDTVLRSLYAEKHYCKVYLQRAITKSL